MFSYDFNATLLNKNISIASTTVEKDKYLRIRDIAKDMNFSYTHDTVLGAAYIWTDLYYDEDFQLVQDEISRAEKHGFVPLSLQNDLNKQITFKELCQMLRLVVNSYNSKLTARWDSIAKKAAVSNSKMTRGDGMLVVLEAAVVMGVNKFNTDWGALNQVIGEKGWDEFNNRNDTIFSNLMNRNAIIDNPDFNYWVASYFFSFGRKSLVTDKTLFDYDGSANSMHSDKALTRKDAIKSVIRLYESIGTEKTVQYMDLFDVSAVTFDKSIITDKLIAKANALPKVTPDNIPYWTGFTYGSCYPNEFFTRYKESDIRNMANWGFNSVRLYMDYRYLFNDNVSKVNLYALQKLDKMISYGMKYNMHISISFPSSPGWWAEMDSNFKYKGSLDFFTNPEHQRQAQNMWKLLAKRYKGIPNSILSFSPIFEPENYTRSTGSDIIKSRNYTTEDMVKGVLDLISTIKTESQERLIISEGTGTRDLRVDPLETEAGKAGSVILANYAADPYIYWNFTDTDDRVHSGFLPGWPMILYNAQTQIAGEKYYNTEARNTPLKLKGELVKGTKFNLYITKVFGSGTFTVTADGKQIYKEEIYPQVGKDGCISKEAGDVYSYRTDDPFSFNLLHAKSDKKISFSLDENIKELKMSFIGSNSGCIQWSEIDVTLPESYSVERWWSESSYDALINGTKSGMFKRKTSQIIIEPIGNDMGGDITINRDVTYSTENVAQRVDKNFISDWLEARIKINDSTPLLLRYEGAFSGRVGENQSKYYDDMLSVFKSHKISWFNNDFDTITAGGGGSYAGDKLVQYGEYGALDTTILKILQKYQ